MEDTSNIASVIKSFKSFDGRGSYLEWPSDSLVMISLTHRDVYKVMQGALRPGSTAAASTAAPPLPVFSDMNTDPAGQIRRWGNACHNLYSVLHLVTAGSTKLLVQTYEGESGPGTGKQHGKPSRTSTLAVPRRRVEQTVKRSSTRARSRGKTPTIISYCCNNDALASRKTGRSSQTNGLRTLCCGA